MHNHADGFTSTNSIQKKAVEFTSCRNRAVNYAQFSPLCPCSCALKLHTSASDPLASSATLMSLFLAEDFRKVPACVQYTTILHQLDISGLEIFALSFFFKTILMERESQTGQSIDQRLLLDNFCIVLHENSYKIQMYQKRRFSSFQNFALPGSQNLL